MSDIAKLVQEARASAARYFHAGSTSTDDLAASIDRLADALETCEAQAAALREAMEPVVKSDLIARSTAQELEEWYLKVSAALASPAGQQMLEEVRRLRAELKKWQGLASDLTHASHADLVKLAKAEADLAVYRHMQEVAKANGFDSLTAAIATAKRDSTEKIRAALRACKNHAVEIGAGDPPAGYEQLEPDSDALRIADACWHNGMEAMETAILNWLYDQDAARQAQQRANGESKA